MGPRNNSVLTFISEAFCYYPIFFETTTVLSIPSSPFPAEDFKCMKSKVLKKKYGESLQN